MYKKVVVLRSKVESPMNRCVSRTGDWQGRTSIERWLKSEIKESPRLSKAKDGRRKNPRRRSPDGARISRRFRRSLLDKELLDGQKGSMDGGPLERGLGCVAAAALAIHFFSNVY